MNLGKNITKIRKDNNLTQDDLAEKYYVTRQTISNWETGKSYPDLETIVKISDDFNISLDILLKEDNKMVKEFDKNIKSTRKYRSILKYSAAFVILLITIFIIYSIVFLHSKNVITNKFDNAISKYKFQKDSYGMYSLKYSDGIEYIIINQEFPKLLDLKLNYEHRSLNCTIITKEQNQFTEIVWKNDGRISMDTIACKSIDDLNSETENCTNIIGSYDSTSQNIDFDELSQKLKINKEILMKAVNQGNIIYNNLYN